MTPDEGKPRPKELTRRALPYAAGACAQCGKPRPAGNSRLCPICRSRQRAVDDQQIRRELKLVGQHIRAVRDGRCKPDSVDPALLRDR